MGSFLVKSSIVMSLVFSHVGHADQKLEVPVSGSELGSAVEAETERLSAQYMSVAQAQAAVDERIKDLNATGSSQSGQSVDVGMSAFVAAAVGLGSMAIHTQTEEFKTQQALAKLLWKKLTMQSVEYRGGGSIFNPYSWARVQDAIKAEAVAKEQLHKFINRIGGPFSDELMGNKYSFVLSVDGNGPAKPKQAARYVKKIPDSLKQRLYILNRNYVLARLNTLGSKVMIVSASPLIALIEGVGAVQSLWRSKFLILGGGLLAYSYLGESDDGRQVKVQFSNDLPSVSAELDQQKEKIIDQLTQLPIKLD
jgi:hypothetical protein